VLERPFRYPAIGAAVFYTSNVIGSVDWGYTEKVHDIKSSFML